LPYKTTSSVNFHYQWKNNGTQSSAPQYDYMFRSFLDHLQVNIFQ